MNLSSINLKIFGQLIANAWAKSVRSSVMQLDVADRNHDERSNSMA
ncbi:MAG: hypothetical protein AAFO95_06455 [Cyanobacteria bacterium J06600_6]